MNNQIEKPQRLILHLLLRHLNIRCDRLSFESIIYFEKIVYLCQVAGADFGYQFYWSFLIGPRSNKLHDNINMMDIIDHSLLDDVLLHPHHTNIIDKIKPLFYPPKNISISNEKWMYLLACYVYLRHLGYLNDDIVNIISSNDLKVCDDLIHLIDVDFAIKGTLLDIKGE